MKKVLFTLVLSLFSANLFAAAKPGWTKYLLHPAAAGGAAPSDSALALLGVERIKDYEAFTLVRVPDSKLASIFSSARDAGFRAEEVAQWDLVETPSGVRIDTRNPVLPVAGILSGYPKAEGIYLIQFAGPIVPQWKDELKASGVKYLSYLPYNAVLVAGSESAVDGFKANRAVQWTSIYHPAFRAQPVGTLLANADSWYVVQVANAAGNESSIRALNEKSVKPAESDRLDDLITNFYVKLNRENVEAFLDDPFVIGIERVLQPGLSSEREAIALTEFRATCNSTTEPHECLEDVYNGRTGQTEPYRHVAKKPSQSYLNWLQNKPILNGSDYLINTSSYKIAFPDTGFDRGQFSSSGNHPDFANVTKQWIEYSQEDGSAQDPAGHGTQVVGMAVGEPTGPAGQFDASSFFYGTGLTPRTSILVQKVFKGDCLGSRVGNSTVPDVLGEYAKDAVSNGAYVQSISFNDYYLYSDGTTCVPVQKTNAPVGTYTANSQKLDEIVRDADPSVSGDQPLIITIAAGNVDQGDSTDAKVVSPATAKNVITVGSAETYLPNPSWAQYDSNGNLKCRYDGVNYSGFRHSTSADAYGFNNVAYLNRRGTVDGRFKPDLIAPGNAVSSTRSQHPNGFELAMCHRFTDYYMNDSGTSFASPQVAAASVLLSKYRNNAKFSPAMMKAALVGSAISVRDGNNRYAGALVGRRPAVEQGFGRLYLGQALSSSWTHEFVEERDARVPTFSQAFTSSGTTRSQTFNVVDPARDTIIVLAWSDYRATVGANPSLVNDLELRVRVPGCGTISYFGNLIGSDEFSFNYCGFGAVTDAKNNVEIVAIPPNTLSSTFTVEIVTKSFGGALDQPFAVYVKNGRL